jgi:hypothetical protein
MRHNIPPGASLGVNRDKRLKFRDLQQYYFEGALLVHMIDSY